MGKMVLALAAKRADVEVVAAVDAPGAASVGTNIEGITVTSDLAAGISAADVYVDFSAPEATRLAAETAREAKTGAVIGTTGLRPQDEAAIEALAQVAPVVVAANFSLGVNVLLALAEQAARALGSDFDPEVVELHHRRKRDAPSGTAIALHQALANGRDWTVDESRCYQREGDVGPRRDKEIGVMAVRGGDIIGEHTAYLIGELERIELTHRAASREIFADGALKTALWIANRDAGRYTMRDVLSL
jgi:4-hydroxy-tetrahydrodipicolinate reductase